MLQWIENHLRLRAQRPGDCAPESRRVVHPLIACDGNPPARRIRAPEIAERGEARQRCAVDRARKGIGKHESDAFGQQALAAHLAFRLPVVLKNRVGNDCAAAIELLGTKRLCEEAVGRIRRILRLCPQSTDERRVQRTGAGLCRFSDITIGVERNARGHDYGTGRRCALEGGASAGVKPRLVHNAGNCRFFLHSPVVFDTVERKRFGRRPIGTGPFAETHAASDRAQLQPFRGVPGFRTRVGVEAHMEPRRAARGGLIGIPELILLHQSKASKLPQAPIPAAIVVAVARAPRRPAGPIVSVDTGDNRNHNRKRRLPCLSLACRLGGLYRRSRVLDCGHESDAVIDAIQQIRFGCTRKVEVEVVGEVSQWSGLGPQKARGPAAAHIGEADVVHAPGRKPVDNALGSEARARLVEPVRDLAAMYVEQVGAAVAIDIGEEQPVRFDVERQCGRMFHAHWIGPASEAKIRPVSDAAAIYAHHVEAAVSRHIRQEQVRI